MAVQNILKILKGRNIQYKQQKIADLYRMQNDENGHYVAYTKEHIVTLLFNIMADTITEGKYADEFHGVKTELARNRNIIEQMFYKYFSKANIAKAYKNHGFIFSRHKKKGKVVYFDSKTTRDYIKLNFPLKSSRVMSQMTPDQRGQPLPTVFDKVTKIGPNQDLLVEASREGLIQIYNLVNTPRGRGRSVTLPSGRSVGKSSMTMMTRKARKLHGGDLPHVDADSGAIPLGGPYHVEGTTARTVDMVKVLQSANFKRTVEKVAGQKLNQTSFELGFNKVLEKLDLYFTINGTTISDIVKNEKNLEVGITIGAAHLQKLMKQGDIPALTELFNEIENELMEELSDPDAKTSKSMKELNTERGAQAIVKGIFGPLTKAGTPDMRFKANKALLNKKGTKTQTSDEFKESYKKLAQAIILSKAKTPKKDTIRKTTGKYDPKTTASDVSLGNLMQLVNRALPRMLKRNMEPPALQYRGLGNPSRPFAGPFNTGVRVTSITQHKKVAGGINVNYTYEKYPYQTFEPGFEQGSVFRDPRKLIQESIRDIMIERKQSRFLNFRRY
jgi:hypothetical protein